MYADSIKIAKIRSVSANSDLAIESAWLFPFQFLIELSEPIKDTLSQSYVTKSVNLNQTPKAINLV